MKKTILVVSLLTRFAGGCSRRGSRASFTQKAYLFNDAGIAKLRAPGSFRTRLPGAKGRSDL
ncbi:MAG: hypothetical protein COX65_05170 [Elusimicrobia bacterium CG_4_10_14_0_2_um_filter_56_8]|nr:MAG: hypothetical protein AUJ51_02955 [Elusimicrobia bacterium CG1_02_56_21]PJA14752.1 MAG: hypothetical protein COX65_05170 [Elusimicrobia bacterium CG_4_10_14_0_2_um_filter_56_8]